MVWFYTLYFYTGYFYLQNNLQQQPSFCKRKDFLSYYQIIRYSMTDFMSIFDL